MNGRSRARAISGLPVQIVTSSGLPGLQISTIGKWGALEAWKSAATVS